MAGIAVRLAAGEPVGGPEEEGYLPRGLRSNTHVRPDRRGARDRPAAGQARRRRPHRGGTHRRPGGARPAGGRRVVASDWRSCPRRGACRRATPISCPPATPTCGSDTRSAASTRSRRGPTNPSTPGSTPRRRNADPNRLVPLDAARELEGRAAFGSLHDAFYTTSGVDTPVATAAKFGQEIAAELLEAKVGAVDPHRHLRHRHALRGNAGEGIRDGRGSRRCSSRRCPRSRRWWGRTASCAGVSITSPTGDPSLAAGDEHELRVAIVERALEMLGTEVGPTTIWELDDDGPTPCRRGVGLVRAGACPRSGALRVEAALANRSSSSGWAVPCVRSRTRSPIHRTRCSSATSRRRTLWDTPRDWWAHPVDGASIAGPTGDIMDQDAFYALLAEVDQFELARMGADPEPGQLPLYRGQDVVGAFAGDHELDESLTPGVLLENLVDQGERRPRAAASAEAGRRRPRDDHPRDRMRRRGGGRSLPARRWQRREGDRRALRSAERQRHRREVLLRGAGARPRGGGRPDRGRHRGTRRRGGRVDRWASSA